jgi:hypothetical protein
VQPEVEEDDLGGAPGSFGSSFSSESNADGEAIPF